MCRPVKGPLREWIAHPPFICLANQRKLVLANVTGMKLKVIHLFIYIQMIAVLNPFAKMRERLLYHLFA